jgi:hypothetical protein
VLELSARATSKFPPPGVQAVNLTMFEAKEKIVQKTLKRGRAPGG